jgi:hypothetical protein
MTRWDLDFMPGLEGLRNETDMYYQQEKEPEKNAVKEAEESNET